MTDRVSGQKEPLWLRLLRMVPVLTILIGVVGSTVWILLHGKPDLGAMLSDLRARPFLCTAVLLALFLLKGFSAFLPYAVICAGAGFLLPLPAALAVTTVGTVGCVSLSFLIGRGAGYTVDGLLARNPKLARFYDGERQHLFLLSFVLRTVGIQSEVLGLLFGTLRMRYPLFLASSMLGILTTMLSHTLLGQAGRVPFPVIVGSYVLDGAVLVGVTLYWYRKHRRQRKNAENAVADGDSGAEKQDK